MKKKRKIDIEYLKEMKHNKKIIRYMLDRSKDIRIVRRSDYNPASKYHFNKMDIPVRDTNLIEYPFYWKESVFYTWYRNLNDINGRINEGRKKLNNPRPGKFMKYEDSWVEKEKEEEVELEHFLSLLSNRDKAIFLKRYYKEKER